MTSLRHGAEAFSWRATYARNQCIFMSDNVEPSCLTESDEKSEREQQRLRPRACGGPPFFGSSGLFTSKTNHPTWLALGT